VIDPLRGARRERTVLLVRPRLTAVTVLALLALAGCGASSSQRATQPPGSSQPATAQAPAAAAAPAPICRHVPRGTVRVIASHGNAKTKFAAGAAAAIPLRSGYAVTVPALAGGTRRMATWYVDRLRGPRTVTSGNTAALQITNWPLDSLAADSVRESQICAAQRLRGPGPLAP
jgi:hypothetical protein